MRSADTIASRWCMDRTAATSLGVGHEVVAGDEAGGPQHAQRVVAEALLRRQRRAQPLGRQIGGPTERVDQHWLGEAERHGVDREVAPRQVGLDVVGEHHVGLAALLGVRLGPVRGDLEGPLALPGADRAEALALRPQVVGPAAQQLLDLLRAGVGGEVDVAAELAAEQQVADDPADEVGAPPAAVNRSAKGRTSARSGAKRSGTIRAGRSRSTGGAPRRPPAGPGRPRWAARGGAGCLRGRPAPRPWSRPGPGGRSRPRA